jgi:hypothetical protein
MKLLTIKEEYVAGSSTLFSSCMGLLCWLLTVGTTTAAAQCVYQQEDSVRIVSLLRNDSLKTTLDFARQFIGVPYVAHTLEGNDEECLVVNTRQLDCTTLVETVTALTICTQRGEKTFDNYKQRLTQLRYRGGRLQGYVSRLHYFSDWIRDKQTMGFVSEIQQPNPPFTAVQKVRVSYMSTHTQAYQALKAHPEWIPVIASQERNLTGLTARFIPKSQVKNSKALRQAIRDGDIIAITCSKAGLDIAHLGFAVWRKDGLHLLNASQLHHRVIEEPMTLDQYLSKHPSHTGIRILRIQQQKQ